MRTLVWQHKNGRVYHRKLRGKKQPVIPRNCVVFKIEPDPTGHIVPIPYP
jgi:hypothetical protein